MAEVNRPLGPVPPAGLSREATAAWNSAVRRLPPKRLRSITAASLGRYARAAAKCTALTQEVAALVKLITSLQELLTTRPASDPDRAILWSALTTLWTLRDRKRDRLLRLRATFLAARQELF